MTPDSPGWLSLLPPALAIFTALTTRRVLAALLAGIVCAALILNVEALHRSPAWTIDYLVETASRPDNLRLVVFSVLVGGLLKLMKDGGAFDAFVLALQRWRGAYGKRTVFGLTWLFGATLILETWSNVLINGATTGPLYDRLGIARARQAYFIHTIGINVVALVLINSWGAFYLALLNAQDVPNPLELMIGGIPYALYCWISLLLVAFVMASGLTIGPMRTLEAQPPSPPRAQAAPPPAATTSSPQSKPRLRYMLVPIATLIGGVLFGLWSTGEGDITAGDGSSSILYAVVAAIFTAGALLRLDRMYTSLEIERKILTGSAEFLDIGLLIVLALALGRVTQDLGTGAFLAELLQATLPIATIPALVFVLGAVMSFATGTSYGTFSIMLPIALPIGAATGLDPEILFGACIAGGVFGDNCSPISDTTIVTSVASGTTVVDHVRSQLPYALIAAGLSIVGYLLLAL